MDSLIPRPYADLLSAADTTDPVDTVTERLMTGEQSVLSAIGWGRGECPAAPGPLTRVEATCRAAVLVALAARHLLGPELITAAVIGRRLAVQLHTLILARYVPGVSHISVFLTDAPAASGRAAAPAPDGADQVPSAIDAQLVDELELAGIVLVRATSPARAAFGANLVVVAGPGDGDRYPGAPVRLARGALVVNASGGDLPQDLADQVGHVFVDDMSLVGRAAEHGLSRPAQVPDRRRSRYRLVGDLRQVVVAEHPGRTGQEQVLLVELLSSAVPARC
jgi:ornithine cyclodeaminase/alanine dehydrogenase-like protein (mu-crystallin family)